MEQKIDKEVFDKFFTESYCPVDYTTVKEEFEQIASVGNDIFTGSYEARNLNRENFILYLTSEAYCDFEAAVQEAMDDLNPEILDAVMDVTEAQEDGDELLPAAVEVVLETGQASVSMLQRRLKLGYSRAARLVDQMEERGYVGPFEGSKPRQLLITREKWQELQMAKGASPAEADKPADRYGSIHDVFESHDALE